MFEGRNVFALWCSKAVNTATLPLFVAVASGALLAGWFSLRHLLTNPAVTVSKVSRKATIRNNKQEGEKWLAHRESMKVRFGRHSHLHGRY